MKSSKREFAIVRPATGLMLLVLMSVSIIGLHASNSCSTDGVFEPGCQIGSAYSATFNPVLVPLPIDSLDTVYFDMSQAQYIGNQVLIPAWFNANDQVFAFDFAFRYDHTRLEYDTILTTAAGSSLLTNSYLNPNDSIVRFTSSQFSAIPNAQPIALVRFNLLGTTALDTSDLFNLVGYLNGDPCSERIIPPGITSLSETETLSEIAVFPNPASDELRIRSAANTRVEIYNIKGNRLIDQFFVKAGQEVQIHTQLWPDGQYLIVFGDGIQNRTCQLIVSH